MNAKHSQDIANHLVYCIALVVVTIPEGLKLAETIAVSSSLKVIVWKEQFNQESKRFRGHGTSYWYLCWDDRVSDWFQDRNLVNLLWS